MATHPEQKPLEIDNQSSEWVVTGDSHGNSSLPLDVNDSGKEPIKSKSVRIMSNFIILITEAPYYLAYLFDST